MKSATTSPNPNRRWAPTKLKNRQRNRLGKQRSQSTVTGRTKPLACTRVLNPSAASLTTFQGDDVRKEAAEQNVAQPSNSGQSFKIIAVLAFI